jgi:hypothetical protein
MKITRAALEQHLACTQGLEDFIERFPNGGEYNEVLLAARQWDADKADGLLREAYIRLLGRSPEFALIQSNYIPTQKFQVFSPLTGAYEQANSLEEVKVLREQLMQQYLAQNIGLFTVAQETMGAAGDSLWFPLTAEDLDSYGENIMAKLFHVFNPLTGMHEQASSIEDAKALRISIMQTYLEQNSNIFTAAQESLSSTGDISWIPVSSEELNGH